MDLSDQRTQIILVVCVGMIFGLYAWFTWLYTPKKEEIRTLETEISQLQDEIQNLQREADQLPDVEARLAVAQAEWAETLKSFPTESKEEEVLGNLSDSEYTAGLFITRIEKGLRRPRELYIEEDWNLTLVGRYSQLGRFISEIASKERRMSVSRMKLTHPSATEGGGGPPGAGSEGAGHAPQEDEVIISLTVTAYVVR